MSSDKTITDTTPTPVIPFSTVTRPLQKPEDLFAFRVPAQGSQEALKLFQIEAIGTAAAAAIEAQLIILAKLSDPSPVRPVPADTIAAIQGAVYKEMVGLVHGLRQHGVAVDTAALQLAWVLFNEALEAKTFLPVPLYPGGPTPARPTIRTGQVNRIVDLVLDVKRKAVLGLVLPA